MSDTLAAAIQRPTPSTLRYNPFLPELLGDPFASYRPLHQSPTMAWYPDAEFWVAARHAHVHEILSSAVFPPNEIRLFIARVAKRAGRSWPHLDRIIAAALFFDTTEDHRSRRRYFVRALNQRPLSSFEPYLTALAGELLDSARRAGGFDAARDFGNLLPLRFMTRMLGIDDADASILLEGMWSSLIAFNFGCSLADYSATNARLGDAIAHMESLVRERRRAPRDDGLSRMVALGDEEGADDALVADRAFFMMFTGIETTATMIASTVRLLHLNPGEWQKLRDGTVAPAAAIEEILRYDSPVPISSRVPTRDMTIGDVTVEAGRIVVVMVAAANRDPDVFPDPDRLDLSRDTSQHVAFAAGAHYCIGASLARLEGRIALGALLDLPPSRLTTDRFEWWPFQTVHRIKSVPVEFI
jgi:cytochrome P450